MDQLQLTHDWNAQNQPGAAVVFCCELLSGFMTRTLGRAFYDAEKGLALIDCEGFAGPMPVQVLEARRS